jgi:hypothetical protein
MLAEPLYPLHARYFAAGDSLRSFTPIRNTWALFLMSVDTYFILEKVTQTEKNVYKKPIYYLFLNCDQ